MGPDDEGKVRVFITSCETGEGAWRTHEDKLKHLYELSDKRYSIASSPESADIILIGNVREENWGKKILEHTLINKYPGKCFSLTNQDAPLTLHHGIYASGKKSILSVGRIRTGSYTMYPDKYLNPYVRTHVLSDQNHIEKEYLLSFIGRNTRNLRDIIPNPARSDLIQEEPSSQSSKLWPLSGAARGDLGAAR